MTAGETISAAGVVAVDVRAPPSSRKRTSAAGAPRVTELAARRMTNLLAGLRDAEELVDRQRRKQRHHSHAIGELDDRQ